jgi:hypothetical protein
LRLERRFDDLPADAVRGLIAEVLRDPAATELREYVVQDECTDLVLRLMYRAAERGEIDPARITARVASVPKDLIRSQYLTRPDGGPVPEEAIAEIVDQVFLPLVRRG